jgi:carbon-monoxide dehydrogenase large subunit
VIGTQPTGQGHETSFAQVLADLIGVDYACIETIVSDTDIVKAGGGSHSGRSMRHAATALCRATEMLIERGTALAARVWQTELANVSFAEGMFGSRSGPALDWFGLVHEAQAKGLLGFEGLEVECTNTMHTPVYPNGCAICEVEVDPATGTVRITRYTEVDDVGRVINPLIVDGQTHGSIATGVGQALGERVVIDPDSGQPLTGSLMDYALPRADELPSFTTELNEVFSPTNPLGIKSAGEGPTTAALPVVINAIVDALKEYGIEDIEMPATPFRVWSAIQHPSASSVKRDVS